MSCVGTFLNVSHVVTADDARGSLVRRPHFLTGAIGGADARAMLVSPFASQTVTRTETSSLRKVDYVCQDAKWKAPKDGMDALYWAKGGVSGVKDETDKHGRQLEIGRAGNL